MSTRNLFLVIVATVVIFGTGVVTGGLLVRNLSIQPKATTPPFAMWRFEMLRRSVDQLDLSPDQRTAVDQIIRTKQERIADLITILEPDLQQVFQDMRDRIRRELTPEQRRRLDEITKRRMQRVTDGRSPSLRSAPSGQPSPPKREPGQP